MWLYRRLLRLFPRPFRDRFAADMADVFRDRWREARRHGPAGVAGFWVRTIVDMATHASAERRAAGVGRATGSAARGRDTVFRTLRQDVRDALRNYRRRPGATAIALVTLALGIGANTAIFSVVDAIFLRPLPYPAADHVAWIYATHRRFNMTHGVENIEDIKYWQAHATTIANLAVLAGGSTTLTGAGEPARVRVDRVTPSFFDVIGVGPVLGRPFTAAEAQAGERVAIVSHDLWVNQFGQRADIVDRVMTLDGQSWRIVGVMPAGFAFPAGIDVWQPFDLGKALPNVYYLGAVARLKPTVTVADAQRDLDRLAAELEAAHPKTRKDRGFNVVSIRDDMAYRAADGARLLQGVVAFVLLIACANLANLLLAQATERRHEFSLRAAIGASRGRLVRQLLTESVVLSTGGALGGVVIASFGLRVPVALLPPGLIDDPAAVAINATVLAFTAGLAIVTGVVCGLAPAWLGASTPLTESLGHGSRTSAGGLSWRHGHRLRAALVAGEIAVAVILLAGGGLLVRSFVALTAQAPGFRTDHLISAQVSLPAARYGSTGARQQFWASLLDRLQAVPGVESAVASNALPFSHWEWQSDFMVAGREDAPNNYAGIRKVTPAYFDALGIPHRAGRDFAAADTAAAAPVTIVSDVFVAKHMAGLSPIGQRIALDRRHPAWLTVVGVVGSTRHLGLDEPPRADLYVPLTQTDGPTSMFIALRTQSAPAAFAQPLAAMIRSLDPLLPVLDVKTMNQRIGASVAEPRFLMALLSAFAGLAALLAAVGVYGVSAFVVGKGRREIGIRFALGARPGQVQAGLLTQGLRVVAAGAAVGLAASWWLTRILETQLFHVSPHDPVTMIVVAFGLVGTAAIACWIPVRLTSHIDPAVVLKGD